MFSFKKKKRTDEEIQKDIEDIKKKIAVEKKALNDLGLLVRMYENAKDDKGLKLTEAKRLEIEKNVQNFKKKKKELKSELPPRPLPQPQIAPAAAESAQSNVAAAAGGGARAEISFSKSKAQVLFDYAPSGPDELDVKSGQIVFVEQEYGYNEDDREWWKVELDGKSGYVPSSYLMSLDSIPGPSSQTANVKQVIASFDYKGNSDDELSFKLGDVITVISQDYPGWWKGQLNGKKGMFPTNYVHTEEQNRAEEQRTQEQNASKPSSTVVEEHPYVQLEEEFAEALFNYRGQYGDEVAFFKGAVIKIIEQETGGWYRGTLGDDLEAGLIPGNYVRIIGEDQTAKFEEKFIVQKAKREARKKEQVISPSRPKPSPPPKKSLEPKKPSSQESPSKPSEDLPVKGTGGAVRNFWKDMEQQGKVLSPRPSAVSPPSTQQKPPLPTHPPPQRPPAAAATTQPSETAPLLQPKEEQKSSSSACCIIL